MPSLLSAYLFGAFFPRRVGCTQQQSRPPSRRLGESTWNRVERPNVADRTTGRPTDYIFQVYRDNHSRGENKIKSNKTKEKIGWKKEGKKKDVPLS